MDWLKKAVKRQQNRYEYTDPIKPKQWAYNENARMWVDAEQLEQERHQQAYEENRRKWQAYEAKEAAKEEEQRRVQRVIDEIKKPVCLTEEEKELAKQIHIDRSQPTFEEWKAEQKRKKQD